MIKKVGKSLYAHKSNLKELLLNLDENQQKNLLNLLKFNGHLCIQYDIIKYNQETNKISLIECNTWEVLYEPIVGDSYCFSSDNSYKIIRGGTKVYHNKWQFVSEDYTGFDIKIAKNRTKEWENIPEIVKNKSRIGNKKYWYEILQKYGLDI